MSSSSHSSALNSRFRESLENSENQGRAPTTNLLKASNQINMLEFLFSLDTRKVFNIQYFSLKVSY